MVKTPRKVEKTPSKPVAVLPKKMAQTMAIIEKAQKVEN